MAVTCCNLVVWSTSSAIASPGRPFSVRACRGCSVSPVSTWCCAHALAVGMLVAASTSRKQAMFAEVLGLAVPTPPAAAAPVAPVAAPAPAGDKPKSKPSKKRSRAEDEEAAAAAAIAEIAAGAGAEAKSVEVHKPAKPAKAGKPTASEPVQQNQPKQKLSRKEKHLLKKPKQVAE